MKAHKIARLTPKGRAHLVRQIAVYGLTPAAAAAGVSARAAAKWRQRARRDGPAGLLDRSSRPGRSQRHTDGQMAERVVRPRRNHRLS